MPLAEPQLLRLGLVGPMPRGAFPSHTHTHTHIRTYSHPLCSITRTTRTYSYALSHDHVQGCSAGNCLNIPEIAGELHKLTRNAPWAQFTVMSPKWWQGKAKVLHTHGRNSIDAEPGLSSAKRAHIHI